MNFPQQGEPGQTSRQGGGAPQARGCCVAWCGAKMLAPNESAAMNQPQQPKPVSALPPANLETRMAALQRLRTQMEELHAHLEYMKLMLRLKDQRSR